MSEKEILQELYEETMDKVFACSANYLMTIPKKGLEAEHEKYRERAEVLDRLIRRDS